MPTVQGIPVVRAAFGAIPVPAEAATTLLGAAGGEQQLVCGIRPEDIALLSSPVASDVAPHATVDQIELVGADRYISLTHGNLLLQARVPADQEWHEGQRVALALACDNRPGSPQLATRIGPMPNLPSGTVTFLFTDIEGGTAFWERDRAALKQVTVPQAVADTPVGWPAIAGATTAQTASTNSPVRRCRG